MIQTILTLLIYAYYNHRYNAHVINSLMFSHHSNGHFTELTKLCWFRPILIVDNTLIELNLPFLFPSYFLSIFCFLPSFSSILSDRFLPLTLSDPTSNLVRQYDFPVLPRCRKTSDTVYVAFFRPPSEPVRRFFSCSTDFSQQIAQVVLFLFLHVFLF
jgi:hypothetical protein